MKVYQVIIDYSSYEASQEFLAGIYDNSEKAIARVGFIKSKIAQMKSAPCPINLEGADKFRNFHSFMQTKTTEENGAYDKWYNNQYHAKEVNSVDIKEFTINEDIPIEIFNI